MGLIIEIILTGVAWKNGWKQIALFPLGVGIVITFLYGFLFGFSGGSTKNLLPFYIVGDFIIIVALAIMCFKKPAANSEVKKEE